MSRLLQFAVLGSLFLLAPARASAQGCKEHLDWLKDTYRDKLTRLRLDAAADSRVRIELPKSERESVDATTPLFLRIGKFGCKGDDLVLTAHRVFLFQDLRGRVYDFEDESGTYRIGLGQSLTSQAETRTLVGKLLTATTLDEQRTGDYWPPRQPAQKSRVPATSREIAPKVFTVGKDMTPPTCISCPDPEYTNPARRAKVNGVVVLWVLVSETGRVMGVQLVKSLGYGLDESAIRTVSRWRFRPAFREGQPVRTTFAVEVSFKIG